MSRDCPEDDPGAFTSRLHIADLDADTVVDLGLMGLEAHSPAWWQGTDGWHVAWLAAVPPADATAVLDVAVPADGTAVDEPADLTAEMTACPDELVQVAGGPPVALFAEGLDTALYRALTQFGAEHELVIYPRENHGFAQRAHRIDVLERTRSWFTRWLGDSAA